MLPDLGFSLQPQYDRPVAEVLPLLKKAGFSAVSPVWSPDLDLDSLCAQVGELNMTVQSLHAPHKGIAYLWTPEASEAQGPMGNVTESLRACARHRIPILVLHGWQGLFYTFPDTPLDFRFFDGLVSQAGELGVRIAFENLEGEEYLAALMDRYRELPQVGFCWDSGHDHCYPHRLDFLASFGDRLIMTHLNDNLGLRDPSGIPSGLDDLHFLPFDGNLNWNRVLDRLRAAPPQSIWNFEFKIRSHSSNPEDLLYTGLSLEEFLEKAGSRARRIRELYNTRR